jgi:hypothetical protein
MSLEINEYPEGNHYFKRHLIQGGNCANVILQRGASFFDAEFWLWMQATIRGTVGSILPPKLELGGQRRNLLLIHFTGYSVAGIPSGGSSSGSAEALAAAGAVAQGFLPDVGGILRVPARAFFLIDCMPIRYKAGTDYDASSSEVTIDELELSVDRFEVASITG